MRFSLEIIKRLKELLPQGKFIRNVTILAGGTAIGQALVVFTLPIVTRLYNPNDLGMFGLFTAYTGVVSVGSSLLYEAAIVSAREEVEAAYLVLISTLLTLLTTPFAILCLYSLITYDLLGFQNLPSITVLWAGISIALSAFFKILRYWFIRQSDFSLVSQSVILQNGTRSMTQLFFGSLNWGWPGLLLGDILGKSAGIARMLTKSLRGLTRRILPLNYTSLKFVLLNQRQFPLYAFPSSVIDVLAANLSIPLLTDLYGIEAAGYYVLSFRVMSLPIGLVGKSFADAFHSKVADYANKEPLAVKGFFFQTARILTLLGLPPAIVLAFIAPSFFGWIFGADWREAGILTSIMIPWALAQFIVSPLSRLVFVLNGQKFKLLYDVSALCVLLLSLYGGATLDAPLNVTVGVLSGFNTLTYGLYFLILLYLVNKNMQNPVQSKPFQSE